MDPSTIACTGDIEQIKIMGANHMILGHAFSPIGRDVNKMIEVTKDLARFARKYTMTRSYSMKLFSLALP